MKKRIISLVMVIIIIIIAVTLTACNEIPEANTTEYTISDISNFKAIEGEDTLFYDISTKIVYYLFSTKYTSGHNGYGYGYMSPYISENGNFCRYVDGKIVEITNNTN